MPRYIPIHPEVNIDFSDSDMIVLRWEKPRLIADFRIPGDADNVARVEFQKALIFRALDEMPLSTEESGPNEGLVAGHLAYKVEDAAFFLQQSPTFRGVNQEAEHYRLVTGWTCLDVVSEHAPSVRIVSKA